MLTRWCKLVEPKNGAAGENADVLLVRGKNGLDVPQMKISS
jgi:hypothetical protein